MKKRLLFLIASFAIITSAFACKVTNMCVRQTDGTIVKYDIEKVEEVYYEDIDIPSTPSEPEEEPETNIPEINPSNPGQVTPQFRYFVISETEAEVIGLNVGSTNIVVPSSTIIDGREYKITSIGDNAFENLRRIETVTLPNTLTTIGNNAFYGCNALTSINITNSVTKIGESAFAYCKNLSNIEIPNSITEIEDGTFDNCESITSIEIPKSITKIGDFAFQNCFNLTNITIPSTVIYIGQYAFNSCNRLEVYIDNYEGDVEVVSTSFASCKSIIYSKGKKDYSVSGVLNGYEYVDLGLPSGTKWATMNIGAKKYTEYGDWFAWGELAPKGKYIPETSAFFGKIGLELISEGIVDIEYNLNPQYDAATQNWGDGWRMPTENEIRELFSECVWTWETIEGINGCKISSKVNDNWIFLPSAGGYYGKETSIGSEGYYWSSSYNDYTMGLLFYDQGDRKDKLIIATSAEYGHSIRPVCKK